MKTNNYPLLPLLATAALLPACVTPDPRPITEHGDGATPSSATKGANADHPFGTGSVEFVGFPLDVLTSSFRVIPEEGDALVVPRPGERIEGVDGFWLRGTPRWFKIPDHCHAIVTRLPDGELRFAHDCDPLGSRIQKLRGQPAAPAFVDDSGATSHPSDYPF